MTHLIIWNSFGTDTAPIRPLGAHQLGTWLSQFNYNVKIIDFCNLMTTEELVKITEKYITDETISIGASTTFWKDRDSELKVFGEPAWALQARDKIENMYPNLKWILGGWQTSKDYQTKEWIKFDGHGEDSVLKFLDNHTKYVLTRQKFDIQSLNKHYLDDLHITPTEVLPMEMSRGCQFKCSFCRYPLIGKKKGTYLRDLKLIREELILNYERYGTTRYSIVDDTVNEDDDKIKGLADIAQSLPFKLEWIGYLRLDLIGSRRHTISMLKDSGLVSAFFGIESFHKDASKIVGKGWNGIYAKDFLIELKHLWNNSISFQLGLIVGLPGETENHLHQTLKWCIENNIDNWTFSPLHIDIGDKRPYKSNFDINYANYGYSFPNPNDNEFWINDNWTRASAIKVSRQLTQISRDHMKVGTWHGANLASLGYSFTDLYNSKIKNLDYNLFYRQTKTFVNEYVRKELANVAQ